jgi:hypothetical protein
MDGWMDRQAGRQAGRLTDWLSTGTPHIPGTFEGTSLALKYATYLYKARVPFLNPFSVMSTEQSTLRKRPITSMRFYRHVWLALQFNQPFSRQLLSRVMMASNGKHQGLEWHRWLFAEVTNITSDQFNTRRMPGDVPHILRQHLFCSNMLDYSPMWV